jgi:hypothetical protein
MLRRDGVVMVEMKVLVIEMVVMMIPMKSGVMVMTMAMISPLHEGIFLADSCWCFPPRRGGGVYL